MLESAATALNNADYRLPGRVPHKISEPTVIAPRELMPLEWIIDYEEENHRRLFEQGYQDARDALDQRLLAGMLGDS